MVTIKLLVMQKSMRTNLQTSMTKLFFKLYDNNLTYNIIINFLYHSTILYPAVANMRGIINLLLILLLCTNIFTMICALTD